MICAGVSAVTMLVSLSFIGSKPYFAKSAPAPMTPVVDTPAGEGSNVEMTWATFGGQHADLYAALIYARCHQDRLGTEREIVANQFRLHLERGLLKLRGRDDTRTLDGLLSIAG